VYAFLRGEQLLPVRRLFVHRLHTKLVSGTIERPVNVVLLPDRHVSFFFDTLFVVVHVESTVGARGRTHIFNSINQKIQDLSAAYLGTIVFNVIRVC
jgi:hypothetical protein